MRLDNDVALDARLHHPPPVQAVLVMLAVALVAFMLFRFVGDPVSQMVGQDDRRGARGAARAARPQRSGFVQFAPLPRQRGAVDFGISYQFKQPVIGADRRAPAGDARAALRAALFVAAGRHSDGRLHGAASRARGCRTSSSPSRWSASRCRPSSSASC